jgi:threonine dehydratase
MNYTDSGQTEGQALMGFEFDKESEQAEFKNWLEESEIRFEPIAVEQVLHQ